MGEGDGSGQWVRVMVMVTTDADVANLTPGDKTLFWIRLNEPHNLDRY